MLYGMQGPSIWRQRCLGALLCTVMSPALTTAAAQGSSDWNQVV